MSCITSKKDVLNWHFLNWSVIYHKLGSPIFVQYLKLTWRNRFKVLWRVSHQPHIIFLYRNNYNDIFVIYDGLGACLRRTLDFGITKINICIQCFTLKLQTKGFSDDAMRPISCQKVIILFVMNCICYSVFSCNPNLFAESIWWIFSINNLFLSLDINFPLF